jgi:uncharacterized membrane protein YsdA (DUF1294 family)
MWSEEAIPFVIVIIIGVYVFALLYLNAKARPGPNRIPERLRPVKYAADLIGGMFLAILFIAVAVLLWYSASCLLSGCPRIE